MSKKLSYDCVKKFFNEKNYILLSENYKKRNSKLLIQCDKNHKYEMSLDSFLNGNRCGICKGGIKLSYEQVKIQIENLGFNLLSSNYENCKKKLLIQCKKGHEFKTSLSCLKQGVKCTFCYGYRTLKSEEIIKILSEENYSLLDKFVINHKDKMNLKCPKNHICFISLNNFKKGVRCVICRGLKKQTFSEIKKFIENNNYKLISEEYLYSNCFSDIEVECPNNHIYKVKFYSFKSGKRCKKCYHQNKDSNGIRLIQKWLISCNLKFIKEFKIKECKNKFSLPFDIAIFKDNKLKGLIEFQGEQHYISKKFFGGEQYLEKIKINDAIKKQYCKDNQIPLLIISYTEEKNIEQLLEKFYRIIISA